MASGGFMQRYSSNLDDNERRIARRWTLGALGFYGSILAAMIAYASTQKPGDNAVSGEPETTASVADALWQQALEKPAGVARQRSCNKPSC
jgi:hypothetical protein